jgi:putative SOS response-associated peptidase YedK
MCGRFAIKFDTGEAEGEFLVKRTLQVFKPNYNVAPTQNIPVVYNDGENVLDSFRWGLIPSWAKDEKIGFKMINSRIETVAEKPSFRKPFIEGRVLIPASGFYEWKKTGEEKQPYYIYVKSRDIFAFAGISARWLSPKGEVRSCSIITKPASPFMSKIHERMPVILEKKYEQQWINPEIMVADDLLSMLQPNPELEAYRISSLVNSPKNNSPDLIRPFSAAKGRLL